MEQGWKLRADVVKHSKKNMQGNITIKLSICHDGSHQAVAIKIHFRSK